MEIFESVRADGLTVFGDRLFWKVGCGSEFEPPTSTVRSRAFTAPTHQIHFAPAGCGPDRVACERLAVDGVSIYWITGDGRVVRIPMTAIADTPAAVPVTVAHTGLAAITGWPYQVGLAVADNNVYWNEGTTVYRAPAAGGDRTPLASLDGGDHVRDLAAVPGGRLAALVGTSLMLIDPADPTSPDVVAADATCFAHGSGKLVWATGPTPTAGSVLRSRPIDGGPTLTHYQATRTAALLGEIRSVAVDAGGVYAHEIRNVTGGPIVRAPLDAAGHSDISDYLIADPIVAGNDHWIYVSDLTTAIFRTPTGSLATEPGAIRITGVEVTQGVQTSDNRVPLLAYRRTFVRVYLTAPRDAHGPWTGVTGRVMVDGAARILSPTGSYAITVPDTGSDRARIEGSLLFELEPEHTRAGARTLTVEIVPPPGRPTTDPSPRTRLPMTFRTRRDGAAVTISYYGLRYSMTGVPADVLAREGVPSPVDPRTGLGNWPARTFDAMLLDRDEALAYLPLVNLGVARWPGDPVNSIAWTGPDVPGDQQAYINGRNWAHGLLDMRAWGDPIQRTVLLQPEMHDYNGLCSSTTPPAAINLQSNGEPGNTLAHELGHSLSMDHTQHVGTNNGGHDENYPREVPSGDDPRDGAYGPEVGFGGRVSPTPLPGQDGTGAGVLWDLMSYRHTGGRPSSWSAPYTYCKMMHAASNGEIDASGIDGYRS